MSVAVQRYEGLAHITMPEERRRVAELRAACERVRAAGRGATVDAICAEARMLGMGSGTLRTAYYKWLAKGDEALVDQRRVKRSRGANLFVGIFARYAENDKNTGSGAWLTMMRDFRTGLVDGSRATYADVWRGVGTWQEVWAKERPFDAVPEVYPSGWIPHGMRYQSVMRARREDPDMLFQIAISRRGRKAAHKFLLDVLQTRRGVPVGAIRQWDDVWHNFDVRLPGYEEVAQPLEFAGYDVASAYKCDTILKPRFTRQDGKRDNLKEQTFRFVFGHAMCVTGFHKDGITNIVEHGTAAIRDPVRKQIKLIPGYGELIRFAESGILSEQVHAGLFIGSGGGNFRMKPLVESSHGKLADRTAHMLGNRGRDAETLHESRNALVRYEERLMRAAAKLPADMAAKIEYGLMSFDEYHAAYRIIESEWGRDWGHRLEGWDDRQITEYSLSESPGEDDWHPVDKLLDMDPDDARAIAAFVKAHPQCARQRYLSRYEFWRAGQANLIRVPMMEMPAFLDERDAAELTVRDNGTIDFSNGYFYGRDQMVYRVDQVRTPGGYLTRFAPGKKLVVKYNPLAADQVWIIDRDNGATIGMAPLHARVPMLDRAAIERSMGQQAHDLARKVMPVRGRHQSEAEARAGRMARNQSALLGLAATGRMDNRLVSEGHELEEETDDVPSAMEVAAAAFEED